MVAKLPELKIRQVLSWADAYHRRTGDWPSAGSGSIPEAPGRTWKSVNYALVTHGYGGASGPSLARLLQAHRGHRNLSNLNPLTINQILRWADLHHRRTGKWPVTASGTVTDAERETWSAVHASLQVGSRGLPGGTTLRQLLARHRGVRNPLALPRLSERRIVSWAKSHVKRTGRWPTTQSGPVSDAPGESWNNIDWALKFRKRGLKAGVRLNVLLANHRVRPMLKRGGPISIATILQLAREHRRRTGRWPNLRTGAVPDGTGSWKDIDRALRRGLRGLPGGTSLTKTLVEHLGIHHWYHSPPLKMVEIQEWAERHRKRTGRWPTWHSGSVDGTEETWGAVFNAMQAGRRGLVPGSRLSRDDARRQGRPPSTRTSVLTPRLVEEWARAHHARTGRWPVTTSGLVIGEKLTWSLIDVAFRDGRHGLPSGLSLSRFLAQRCNVRHRFDPPKLSVTQIIQWARLDAEKMGHWPSSRSGVVLSAPGENWGTIDEAMRLGRRGLAPGSGLVHLVAAYRGRPFQRRGPKLTLSQVLAWARSHRDQTGDWPHENSGAVLDAPSETWQKISHVLKIGQRGLGTNVSLAQLLSKHYGARNRRNPPPLKFRDILKWADGYYERTGDWPSSGSGKIPEFPGESWWSVNCAMIEGRRGLPGGWSIVRLLSRHRRRLYARKGIPLSIEQIMEWARAHHERTGELPTRSSAEVRDEPGEMWGAIDASLRHGARNLRGGSSLELLLKGRYQPAYAGVGQRLSVSMITNWVYDYRRRAGRWPHAKIGFVNKGGGERWSTIDLALRAGHRGLPGGSSLKKLLAEHAIKSPKRRATGT